MKTETLKPWQIGNSGNGIYNIFYTDGELRSQIAVLRPEWLCDEHGGSPLSNALFITSACNNYERVLAERDELAQALTGIIKWADADCDPSRKSLEKARAAIAKLKGMNP